MNEENNSLMSALVKGREMSRIVHNTLVAIRSAGEAKKLGGTVLLLKKAEYAALRASMVLKTARNLLSLEYNGAELNYIKMLRNDISDTLERALVLTGEYEADNSGPDVA